MIRGRCTSWVVFQRQAPGKDRAGNRNGEWQNLGGKGFYAEVQDGLYSRSGTGGLQEQSWSTVRVVVPWDPTLAMATAEDRIILQDGRHLDIRGEALGKEGKDMLTFLCEVHAADAVNR